MTAYVLTRKAEEDLGDIDDYVASEFGNAVAEQVTARLFDAFKLLADQPGIGAARPHWTLGDVLFWAVPNTPSLIIYRPSDPLQILRIWNARQDPRKLGSGLS